MGATPIIVEGDGITGETFENRYLNLDGMAGKTFTKCVFTKCGQIRGEGAHHIDFIDCTFEFLLPDNAKQVQLFPGNHHWRWFGCIARHLGDFVYANEIDGLGADHLTLDNCHGEYIGTDPEHKSIDGHFLGAQAVSHVSMRSCTTFFTGPPVSAWASAGTPFYDWNINDNEFYLIKKMPWMQTNGNAIEFSGTDPLGQRYNLRTRRNKIFSADGFGLTSNSTANVNGHTTNQYFDCRAGNERINGVVL